MFQFDNLILLGAIANPF